MCCLSVSYAINTAAVLENSAEFALALISPLSFVVTVFVANCVADVLLFYSDLSL